MPEEGNSPKEVINRFYFSSSPLVLLEFSALSMLNFPTPYWEGNRFQKRDSCNHPTPVSMSTGTSDGIYFSQRASSLWSERDNLMSVIKFIGIHLALTMCPHFARGFSRRIIVVVGKFKMYSNTLVISNR